MNDLLDDLLETLDLLIAQTQAYQRVLPADNYQALAAVNSLGELIRQAHNQANDLEEYVQRNEEGQLEGGAEHPFSPRELEVLKLTAKGLTNKEIAYRLHLSERTIQYHLRSVFNKTGTDSRTEAVAQAIHNGWI